MNLDFVETPILTGMKPGARASEHTESRIKVALRLCEYLSIFKDRAVSAESI